ncbi:hypothetical protein [Parendozoicomonas haliclonae]|uniref:Uncharacterized protein n=1 Tax=Parendozoicomonas haliclonae TaxID=1960125 RepID=A0A1X7AS95_9GAMM|nr:hypothetical protein [Parendozoicomonas haliclonae]SMA50979.1 hypothetical protein EHSB41UT_04802 [Parendozoicomonas haliclonae]
MKNILAVIILIFGLIGLATSSSNLPSGANPQFAIGYFLPSALIIAVGIILLTWKKKDK